MLHTWDDETQHIRIPYYCKILERTLMRKDVLIEKTFLVADLYKLRLERERGKVWEEVNPESYWQRAIDNELKLNWYLVEFNTFFLLPYPKSKRLYTLPAKQSSILSLSPGFHLGEGGARPPHPWKLAAPPLRVATNHMHNTCRCKNLNVNSGKTCSFARFLPINYVQLRTGGESSSILYPHVSVKPLHNIPYRFVHQLHYANNVCLNIKEVPGAIVYVLYRCIHRSKSTVTI